MLNGANFWLKLGDEPKRMGFFATRCVEAENPEAAELAAVCVRTWQHASFPVPIGGDGTFVPYRRVSSDSTIPPRSNPIRPDGYPDSAA